MSVQAFRRQLWASVEQHPTSLAPDAEQELRRRLDEAANRLATDPDRADEAQQNLARLLDAAQHSTDSSNQPADVDIATVGDAEITADALSNALRDLCPLFPIC